MTRSGHRGPDVTRLPAATEEGSPIMMPVQSIPARFPSRPAPAAALTPNLETR